VKSRPFFCRTKTKRAQKVASRHLETKTWRQQHLMSLTLLILLVLTNIRMIFLPIIVAGTITNCLNFNCRSKTPCTVRVRNYPPLFNAVRYFPSRWFILLLHVQIHTQPVAVNRKHAAANRGQKSDRPPHHGCQPLDQLSHLRSFSLIYFSTARPDS